MIRLSSILIPLLTLASCRDCSDKAQAQQAVSAAGGREPIKCVLQSGGFDTGGHYQTETFVCVDADRITWHCDDEECLQVVP